MNDHNERACRKCGSLQHHEDVCPKPPTPSVGSDEIGETDLASAKVKVGYALGCGSFSYSMGKDIGILLKHIKNAEKELTTLKSNLDEARRDKERLLSLVPSEAELQAGRDAVSPALNRLVNAGFKATSPQFALDVSAIVDHITFMNNALASMSPTSTT